VFNRIKPEFGSTIGVFGCGTVGCSAIMAARIAGCAEILAIDINPRNLELARDLGATQTLNAKTETDIVARIKQLTGNGLHYAVDTSGSTQSVKNALASLRFAGTVVVLGVTGDLTINVQEELMGEGKSLVGCVEGDANSRIFIPRLLSYYKAGRFPFDKLIRFYDFSDINQAFADAHAGKVVKAVLKMTAK